MGRRPRRRSPRWTPVAVCCPTVELCLERAGHADAVLVHREPVVAFGVGERLLGHQVVLVGGVEHAPAERGLEHVLPVGDGVDDRAGLVDGVQSHRRLTVELGDAERHDGHRIEFGILVEDAGERVVEDRAVVDTRAHHDLAAHGDAVIEQRPQPSQAHASSRVLQHLAAHVGIGGVDAHVQRRQALGDHPFEVGLGEPGQGGEVPVEERQPVVVVLQVEARAHALGQLVDEAELAVVVARAHPVEHRARHLDTERLSGRLDDRERVLETTAADVEVDSRHRRQRAATR